MNTRTVRLTTRSSRMLHQRDEGFTLIELLVVIIIIGILAAIAIPLFLNQRNSAWQASVKDDVHGATLAVETYAAANGGTLPGPGFVNNASPSAVKSQISTSSVTLTVSAGNKIQLLTSANGLYYTIVGSNTNVGAAWFYVYNSVQGSAGATSGTPTAAATS